MESPTETPRPTRRVRRSEDVGPPSSAGARHVMILGESWEPTIGPITGPTTEPTTGPQTWPEPGGVEVPRERPDTAGVPRHLRRRPRRVPWLIPVLAGITMTAVFVSQVSRPVATPKADISAPAALTVSGSVPKLPWPSTGGAAVAVPEAGYFAVPGPQSPVPVASLTKIMTAYLVLKDHPLATGASGPSLVMTPADQQDATDNALANQTSVPLTSGQSFSERQLLDGLMVHSANDFADALARWDAGSLGAFVTKMNAQAAALHMTQTHYADPSGIDPADISTAGDQLHLGALAMEDPTFAAVVNQPTVTFPAVGVLSNYVPMVGSFGVVGVKSGFTQAAMGCVVLAAWRTVAGKRVLIMASSTGQNDGVDPVRAAENVALGLIDAAATGVQQVSVVKPDTAVATLSAPWTSVHVPVVTTTSLTTLAWPGDVVSFEVSLSRRGGGRSAGATAGTLWVIDGSRRFAVSLRSVAAVPGPSWHWRYSHR